MVITKDGKILKKAARFSKNARLNPSRMPVYSNGTFYWVANRVNSDQLYIYSLKL